MKKQFKQAIAMLLSAVLLFSLVYIGPKTAAAAAEVTVPDGTYDVGFKYLYDGKESTSVMNDYAKAGTGKLIVENGKFYFENQWNNYTWFMHFSARNAGSPKAEINNNVPSNMEGYTDVTTRIVDNNPDTVIARMELPNILDKQDVLIHIIATGLPFVYDNWYNVQLKIDTTNVPIVPVGGGNENPAPVVNITQFNELITVAQSVYESTYEGAGDGFYTPGSKLSLYNAIQAAKQTAGSNPTEDQVTAGYVLLETALRNFEAFKIVVSKTALVQAVEEASAFIAAVKEFGATSGSADVRSIGEYPSDLKAAVAASVTAANTTISNANATQVEVNAAAADLASKIADLKANELTQSTVTMSVLTDLTSTAQQSEWADYFGKTATVLKSGSKLYANITINKSSEIDLNALLYLRPAVDGSATFTGSTHNRTLGQVSRNIEKDTYVGQLEFNRSNTATTSGIVSFKFTPVATGVSQIVYLSFNTDELNALNVAIGKANGLHKVISESPLSGQNTDKLASLQAAIDLASPVAANKAAIKKDIAAAAAALQTALDLFKEGTFDALPFQVMHATQNSLSTMKDYFVSPAEKVTIDGSTYVIFTVKSSSLVTAFKVKEDGVLVDTEIVSSDAASDTRVVKFKVNDLTALLDAQVHIFIPYVIDPRTGTPYNADHNIRLNFDAGDASVLNADAAAAQALHDAAAAGTAVGEYPAAAKEKLQTAINTAKTFAAVAVVSKTQVTAAKAALEQAVIAFKAAKVLADGTYNLVVKTFDGDLSSHLNEAGSLVVSGANHLVTFTPKAGVAVKKLINNATNEEILPATVTTGSNAGAALVHSLVMAAVATGTPVKFSVPNLSDTYTLVLGVNGLAADLEYAVQFADIAASTDTGTTPGTTPGTELPPVVTPGQLADGNYFLQFEIKKYGTDNKSVMQDYVISPGLLKVSGGTKTFYMTLKQDKEITGLKFNNNSVSVESRDTVNNTRVVYFNVPNINNRIDGWVKIDWAAMNYFHEYDIQIEFYPNTLVATAGSVAPGVGDVEVIEEKDPNAGKDDLNEPVVTDFKDIQGHWAQASIEKALELGIVKGYSDGKFRPNGVITRAEFAVLISRALKLTDGSTSATFNDSKQIPAWAKPHIDRAAKAGLISGYANGTFLPSREINRSELASIIVRAAKLDIDETNELSFADAASIPDWAKNDIAAAAKAGYIQGKGGNKFEPLANATRAEALTLIMKLLETK
ncbi:hypothetical protein BBD42_13935 [Paenibacillus sp. BIHB 4019]|uniref:NEAT domain-containing protein n=1 Tax=Paenibacillus sp. BIHB 4019 TaxID=1870819 RepID=A0A1B2DI85_9BACL|nr:NEAT domain-containing protein [Paenibacillus sp. BIHB 4019]ANY67447.1 hypothetical protein BBD42_13935 [Paenibacillus sp. BIHB 4019]